jgi:hypothetical protein
MILGYERRQELWEWCRDYIDREAIYRVDETHPMLPGKNPKGRYTFQFYLRRATFNPEFAHKGQTAVLGRIRGNIPKSSVQICTPEPSGRRSAPLSRPTPCSASRSTCSRLSARPSLRPGQLVQRQVLPGVPVLMVEDIAASALFKLRAAVQVQRN